MLSSAHASRLSPQRRASAIRAYIVRYLTDLNQHMIKGQSYDEQSTHAHSDDRLAELVQFGLCRLRWSLPMVRPGTHGGREDITVDASLGYFRDNVADVKMCRVLGRKD